MSIQAVLLFLAILTGLAIVGIVLAYLLGFVYVFLRSFYLLMAAFFKDPIGASVAMRLGSDDKKSEQVKELVESVIDDEVAKTLAWFATPLDVTLDAIRVRKYLLTHKEVRQRLHRMRQWKHQQRKNRG